MFVSKIRNETKNPGNNRNIANDNIPKEIVEIDPCQSVREIASLTNVSHSTIVGHLTKMSKVKKMDQWVPRVSSDVPKLTM